LGKERTVMDNYKLTVTVTSSSLSELIEYTSATQGATLEGVEKVPGSNGNSAKPKAVQVVKHQEAEDGVDPRLVFKRSAHPNCKNYPSKRVVDIDASLENVGLTRRWLTSHPVKTGTVEHSIKHAIVHEKRALDKKKAAAVEQGSLGIDRNTNLFKVG